MLHYCIAIFAISTSLQSLCTLINDTFPNKYSITVRFAVVKKSKSCAEVFKGDLLYMTDKRQNL